MSNPLKSINLGGGASDALTPSSFNWTTNASLMIINGGDLAYTTQYNQVLQIGKLAIWQWSFAQTTAGTGTTPIAIIPPGFSSTFASCENVGSVASADSANNNVYQSMNAEAIGASQYIQIRRTDTLTYIRGGNLVGNANINRYAGSCIFMLL